MFKKLLLLHKKTVIAATLFSVISALAGIAVISLINLEIEHIGKANADFYQGLGLFLLALGAFLLAGVISQYILTTLSVRVMVSIREQMVQRVLSTSYEQIEKIGGHRVLATLTKDIEALTNTLGAVPHLAYNFATVLFCLAYMAYQSWQLFLWVALVLIVAVVVIQLVMAVGIRRFARVRELDDVLFKNFRALVDGGKELNINYNRKKYFYRAVVQPNINDIRHSTVSAHLIFILLNNWASMMLFLALGVVVFASQKFFSAIPAEAVVGFVLTLIYVVGPLSVLINTYSVLAEGIVSSQKIEQLELSALSCNTEKTLTPPADWSELQICQLQYEYKTDDDYHFVLGPLDLTIHRGEIVYLIGGNGCGKSTFAKLLCGLYRPSAGTIMLDGSDAAADPDWYRSHFSTIFSDFYLFPHVLNAAGEPADDASINHYLHKLQLADKVQVRNGVLSTTDLSHGQRKRLALLLAYMEDAPIYIFDEWAADQDPYFREFFYSELLFELSARQKTVIVITHDDAYFALADRVIRFAQGNIEPHTPAASVAAHPPVLQPS